MNLKLHRQSLLLLSGLLFGLAIACQSGGDEPTVEPSESGSGVVYKPTPYTFRVPANFPAPTYDLKQNPLTAEGVSLGRSLFYDARLSRDGTVSCGFCHQQSAAFAHTDHALSHGIGDRVGPRNVLNIQNVAWSANFFWDGSIHDLDVLPIAPIENPVEMDEQLPNVLARLQQSADYPPRFKRAFGSDTITTSRFLKALSQFMLTMISADSRYDKYRRGEAGGELTTDEEAGLSLFNQKCASCHAGELFTDGQFRNNGLPPRGTGDQGRFTVTQQEEDRLKFRVPSLRNVTRTMPYMHDGRFYSLEAVLKHYATGVHNGPTLDPLMKSSDRVGIPLTDAEKRQLIAFLETLTDYQFLTNRLFSER